MEEGQTILALATLSVKPEFQRQGAALISRADRLAKQSGYQHSSVLGSKPYYPQFGYIPARQLEITPLEGIRSPNLMAVKLQENAILLGSPVIYAKDFGL